ncbi:MAG TPA: GNAT family N-acetyltransferase [Longimicrobium sp.]|nr:GNAT family N-acetyltransferase [Longimicrobium sp.]
MSPTVEVTSASPDEEALLANLLELYSHDMSEFLDVTIGADGRFGYPPLPLYWREEGRHPFLLKVDGAVAGFALVARGSRAFGDPNVWDMSEFFVLRGYRRRGIGAAAAREVWRRITGKWDVRVLDANPALAFWRATAESFAPWEWGERDIVLRGQMWRVLSFDSPVEGGG